MRTLFVVVAVVVAGACAPDTDLRNQASSSPGGASADAPAKPDAGMATGSLIDPMNASAGVPTNLRQVILAFSEEVQQGGGPGPNLLGADGTAVPLALGGHMACTGVCRVFDVGGALAPSTRYRVELPEGGLSFGDGKPLGAGTLGAFTTSHSADDFAPRIQAFSTAIVEGCLAFHLVADELVRVQVEIAGEGAALSVESAGFSATHDFSRFEERLPWGCLATVRATVHDQAGNPATAEGGSVLFPAPLPTVALVELLPNPAGSETTQEWVEIVNDGPEAVELGGLVLADKAGSDVLPVHALLPGERALIVGESYDPADPKDIQPREGTAILRVAGKLGGDGLSNTSDEVRLQTAKGEVISQYGGHVNTSATAWSGKSVSRVAPRACDGPGAWKGTPQIPTPGW